MSEIGQKSNDIACKLCGRDVSQDVFDKHLRDDHCSDQKEYTAMFCIEFDTM